MRPSRERDPSSLEAAPPAAIGLPLLIRLRWLGVPGQVVALLSLPPLLGIAAPPAALLVPVAAAASNLFASRVLIHRLPASAVAASLIILDTVLLTLWLGWAGGAVNPFTILYLVQIALAALVLGPRWTWGTAGLAVLCFGLLLLFDPGTGSMGAGHAGQGANQLDVHLRGMWVAFALAAALTALFVALLRRDLDRRERELVLARAEQSRTERLAALSAVVGSAAHELSTPVATLALAAAEIESRLDRASPELRRELDPELEAMRHQAARCRQILDEMGDRAGRARGEGPRRARLADLMEDALRDLAPAQRRRVHCAAVDPDLAVTVPHGAVVRSIAALVRNACDASPVGGSGDERVEIRGGRRGGAVEIAVLDRGKGMSDRELERVGEPFFTTKPMGRGLGLGLYMSRSVIDQLGGSIDLQRRPGGGIRALLRLPLEAPAAAGGAR